jgi:peptidoglycan hydrolase-like protein with peptidoglycan-binding domain
MSGPDVSDWQVFLKGRGLFQSAVDGRFGPISDAGTRAYQANGGLTSDGIVGPITMASAVDDGYQSTTGANLAGMDASAGCSEFAASLSAVGIEFVARYYSNNADKTLTPAEAQDLSGASLGIVAVFENANNAASLFSADAGTRHAAKALELAAGVGQPAGTAIYFAVDFDATPADVEGPVSAYFDAISESLAPAQYAIGVYGSGLTCRLIRDAGLARFTWLTGSIGFREYSSFRTQADIVQLAPERDLFDGQLSIDDDIAQSAEFGAFRIAQAETATGIST